MLAIISFILATIIGVVSLTFMVIKGTDSKLWFCGTLLSLCYGCFGLIVHGYMNDIIKRDLRQYCEAKAECEYINSSDTLPQSVFNKYAEDIEKTNKMIDKSRKYHDHIYLSVFFSKECAEFEKLNYKACVMLPDKEWAKNK